MIALALAATSFSWLAVVALSENNWTLLGVAMIGAVGSVTAAVIAAGTRRRVERLEQEHRKRRLVAVKAEEGTFIADEDLEDLR